MENVSLEHSIKEIVVANKARVAVKCSGDVQITTLTEKCEYNVVVEGVLLTTNLLSVGQLITKGNKVVFEEDCCQIFNRADELVATAYLINGIYKLNTPTCYFDSTTAALWSLQSFGNADWDMSTATT